MRKFHIFLTLFALLGSSGAAYAQNTLKPKKPEPSLQKQPGKFDLDLNTDKPFTSAPSAPPGVSNLTRESNTPFLGLKLSKPLGN